MQGPLVSIVIPAYNSEKYVADAVKSVLQQTYVSREVIVVDDGSTDGTAAALKPFSDVVRYLHQTNRGEPAARNLGIRNARGEYIAFVDADDLWLPEKLARQMAYLAAHPNCAFVYTDMSTFDEHGVIDPSVKVRFHLTFPTGNIFRPLFYETLFGSGSMVFRKDCVEKTGYFDEEFLVGSDYEMWLRLARHFEGGVVDMPLLMYRQHSTMSMRGLGKALWNGVPWEAAVLKKILRLYPEVPDELGRSFVNQRLSKPYANLAQLHFQQQDHRTARQLFREALRYWPGNLHYRLSYLATFLSPGQLAALRKAYRKLLPRPAAQSSSASRAHAAS
jgi:glycosyltransferase involved in cell wall biosynthesis